MRPGLVETDLKARGTNRITISSRCLARDVLHLQQMHTEHEQPMIPVRDVISISTIVGTINCSDFRNGRSITVAEFENHLDTCLITGGGSENWSDDYNLPYN